MWVDCCHNKKYLKYCLLEIVGGRARNFSRFVKEIHADPRGGTPFFQKDLPGRLCVNRLKIRCSKLTWDVSPRLPPFFRASWFMDFMQHHQSNDFPGPQFLCPCVQIILPAISPRPNTLNRTTYFTADDRNVLIICIPPPPEAFQYHIVTRILDKRSCSSCFSVGSSSWWPNGARSVT